MNWPLLFIIIGFLMTTWSRIGYISTSGTKVFIVSIFKMVLSLAGLILIFFGIILQL